MAYPRSTQYVGAYCTLPKLALMRGSLILHHLSRVVWISRSSVHESNGTILGQIVEAHPQLASRVLTVGWD